MLTDFKIYFTVWIRRTFVIGLLLLIGLKIPPENKTTSVKTLFKKLTTGNNVFIVSGIISKVTVAFCSFYTKCSICPPCCWTTHS